MQSMKVPFNKFQQKKYQENAERYAKASRVDLPNLVSERYGVNFACSGNHFDAVGEQFRIFLTDRTGEDLWRAIGVVNGCGVTAVQQLEEKFLNKKISANDALVIIENFTQSKGIDVSSNAHQARAVTKSFNFSGSYRDTSGVIADYIKSRGIGWKTFNNAVEAGFTDKTRDGVRFIGLDANGHPKNAETRLVEPKMLGGKLTKFICTPGSDRSYPPILPGNDKGEVHVVEGGFSALGLKEIMSRQGWSPTIIVSGGKDNTSWLRHVHVKALIKDVAVTLHIENEKSKEIQAQADISNDKQAQKIMEAGALKVIKQSLPAGYKDNADLNLYFKQQTQQQFQSKVR